MSAESTPAARGRASRRPRFRLTVRRMMILMAIIALGCWASVMMKIRRHRLGLAETQDQHVRSWDRFIRANQQEMANGPPVGIGARIDLPNVPPEAQERMRKSFEEGMIREYHRRGELLATQRRKSAYHAALADHYRHAANRPWLPLTPDPPEPK